MGFVLKQNAQNTFSPYSRYAIGELAQPTFAHNTAMGGAFVALKQDSTMPNFINVGNPASYALIRLATLELGINTTFSEFKGQTASSFEKTANFAYGALGFPIGRKGGASFGIMPYTYVGSNTANTIEEPGIGEVDYQYQGSGGLNKIYLGYGVMPFNQRLIKFRRKHLQIHDSLKGLSHSKYKLRETFAKLLSDFAIGANGNLIKGNIMNSARVVYPDNSLYYNSFRDRIFSVSDVTANFGLQTGLTIDSVKTSTGKKRALNEKVKFTFGYTFNLSNALNTYYTAMAYNYRVSNGTEFIVDTVYYKVDEPASVTLPFEQGFGIGFKKGEKLNIVADYAITNWQNFQYLDNVSTLKQNHRFAIGAYFVPEKYAVGSGSFFRRVNYRMGANYHTGYVDVNGTLINSYSFSAGLGLPVGVGRLSSMVHLGATYGKMGTTANGLIMENFWRLNIGFTFSDKWFQKYRYD
jgi:hypothetical protein